MGTPGYRDQGWEERKHVDTAGEEGIRQPDSRVSSWWPLDGKKILVVTICSERGDLDRLFTEKRVGIYMGVDPTGPSMHVGHLLPLMVLYWMYFHGFHACSLVGIL